MGGETDCNDFNLRFRFSFNKWAKNKWRTLLSGHAERMKTDLKFSKAEETIHSKKLTSKCVQFFFLIEINLGKNSHGSWQVPEQIRTLRLQTMKNYINWRIMTALKRREWNVFWAVAILDESAAKKKPTNEKTSTKKLKVMCIMRAAWTAVISSGARMTATLYQFFIRNSTFKKEHTNKRFFQRHKKVTKLSKQNTVRGAVSSSHL